MYYTQLFKNTNRQQNKGVNKVYKSLQGAMAYAIRESKKYDVSHVNIRYKDMGRDINITYDNGFCINWSGYFEDFEEV
jgi:hypothetical protein